MKFFALFKPILGFVALSLAAVGLFFPVLPTTPFVLLAVGCFSTTPKLRAKVLKIRFVREYYDSYTAGEKLRQKTVATSLVFLWLMLGISMLLTNTLWVVLLLSAVGIAVTTHILWIAGGRAKKHRFMGRHPDDDKTVCTEAD